MAHSYGGKHDEDVIDLRGSGEEPEFRIGRVEDNAVEVGQVQATKVTELEGAAMKAYDKVKVKFNKFVNLIATHAYQEIFDKHENEDVIISTDLLADLANAHEEKEENKKGPLFLVMGIVVGAAIMYILLNK